MTSQDIYYVPAFLSFHFTKINNSTVSSSLFVAVKQKGKCLLRPILESSPLLIFITMEQSSENCRLKKKTFCPAAFRQKFRCENSYSSSYNYPIHHELSFCHSLSLIESVLTPDKNAKRRIHIIHLHKEGTAVAQCLRCCATNRKVADSIAAGVIGIFHRHKILLIALWPWGRLSL